MTAWRVFHGQDRRLMIRVPHGETFGRGVARSGDRAATKVYLAF